MKAVQVGKPRRYCCPVAVVAHHRRSLRRRGFCSRCNCSQRTGVASLETFCLRCRGLPSTTTHTVSFKQQCLVLFWGMALNSARSVAGLKHVRFLLFLALQTAFEHHPRFSPNFRRFFSEKAHPRQHDKATKLTHTHTVTDRFPSALAITNFPPLLRPAFLRHSAYATRPSRE